MINKSHFEHDTRNFTIEDFCSKHICANALLDKHEHCVAPCNQVNAFLDKVTNCNLIHIKTQILGQAVTCSNLKAMTIMFKDLYKIMKPAGQHRDSR